MTDDVIHAAWYHIKFINKAIFANLQHRPLNSFKETYLEYKIFCSHGSSLFSSPHPLDFNALVIFSSKAGGVHVKAVLTSLNTALLPIARVTFLATSAKYLYFINHCLAVLCKFLGDFGAFWERDIFLKG